MADESTTPATKQGGTKSTAAKTTGAKKTARKSSTKKSATKKSTAKKAPAKKTARKSPTKKSAATSTAKKTAKKTAGRRASTKATKAAKTTAQKTPARRPANLTAAQRVTETVRDTTTSAAATGKTVVAKAAAAAQGPVETGRALVGKAGERAADAGRAVLTPSAQFLASAQTRAKELVADPGALRGLADRALRSKSGRSGPLGEVADEFKTLGRLVAAYSRGDYRDIPFDSLLTVIAGLVYVVSPLDLVPEAVPIAGYADDAVAVGFVIRQVHHELAAFREWESRQPATKQR